MIAFIFADLIAFPLLLIYRRYYGTALMVRMLVGLLGAHVDRGPADRVALPGGRPGADLRPTTIAPAHFSWNYTTYLNLFFLARLRRLVLAVPQPGAAGR